MDLSTPSKGKAELDDEEIDVPDNVESALGDLFELLVDRVRTSLSLR